MEEAYFLLGEVGAEVGVVHLEVLVVLVVGERSYLWEVVVVVA